jgi:hypothetical protein
MTDEPGPAPMEGPQAVVEEPPSGLASTAEGVRRVRAQIADAGVAARRTLDRIGWTRVIVVAVIQLVIGLIAWRVAVRRDRRHRRRVQLWVEDVLGIVPARRRRRGRRFRIRV